MNDAGTHGAGPDPQSDEHAAEAVPDHRRRDEEPDLLLDVSELKVDEISLDVEDLRARVALQADVLELLKLHVGVEADLGRVQLTIKGVEAKVLLKVRLDNVARILDRVLTTIDSNPEIVERLAERVGATAEELGAGAGEAAGELGSGAASAAEEVADDAGTAARQVTRGAGRAVDQVGPGEQEPSREGRRRRSKAEGPKKRSGKPTRTSRQRRSREDG